MRCCSPVLILLLLSACSTGPWKAPQPEQVARTCEPPAGMEIRAEVAGGNERYRSTTTVTCDTHTVRTHGARTYEERFRLRSGTVDYSHKTPKGALSIREHTEVGGGVRRDYQRAESIKTPVGTAGSFFGFSFRVGGH